VIVGLTLACVPFITRLGVWHGCSLAFELIGAACTASVGAATAVRQGPAALSRSLGRLRYRATVIGRSLALPAALRAAGLIALDYQQARSVDDLAPGFGAAWYASAVSGLAAEDR
jgi:hypothetical protein